MTKWAVEHQFTKQTQSVLKLPSIEITEYIAKLLVSAEVDGVTISKAKKKALNDQTNACRFIQYINAECGISS